MWQRFDWRFRKNDGDRNNQFTAEELKQLDPHYREMLKYPDAPNSWYFITFVLSLIVSLVVIYESNSTLPWFVLYILAVDDLLLTSLK